MPPQLDDTIAPPLGDDPSRRSAGEDGPAQLEPGTLVGRFAILSKLGSGGMGVVYLAYDPELDRKIALKFLHERRSCKTARASREAQALGRISHPNVVAIHDVGTFDDRVWLAMEYVEGPTLDEWLAAEARPWREIVDVLLAAGRGVVAVHAAGLVHRDLKPSNLMIGADGRVRVMDFGLVCAEARTSLSSTVDDSLMDSGASGSLVDVLATQSRTGAVMGTPAYMAPEQFRGDAVEARTDQFSFCAVAWRALYGERPFAGDSFAELRFGVIHGRRRPPVVGAEVPRWLREVIARGLAVDPAARWPSMQALLEALDSGRHRALVRRVAASAAGLAAIATLVAAALH